MVVAIQMLYRQEILCRDDAVSSLITPKFIKCLGNNSNKQTYLNKASNQALQKLSERVKDLPSQVADEVVSKISNYSGNQLGHYFKSRFNVMVCNVVEMCAFYPHVIDIFLIVAG